MSTVRYKVHRDEAVLRCVAPNEISALTDRATAATFYRESLTPVQIAANRRIVDISTMSCLEASQAEHQSLAAIFIRDRLAGYVISTRHNADDLELDWLMVDPAHHGTGIAAALIEAGIKWLGEDQPIWLNVISYNQRAIRFYAKFGFEIDPSAATEHTVPHLIMRRLAKQTTSSA